jgi:putative peptide zinc metalloprotease protein
VERECGFRVTLAELEAFAHHARDIGLLECSGSPRVTRSRSCGLSWNLPLWNPERVFAWCASRASFLFHPMSIAAGVLIVAVAAASFSEGTHGRPLLHIPSAIQLATFLTLLNIISIVHECGHGLVLHRCGGRVREIGVRFVLGWPCWYCDITESYLLPRLRQRVAVILAGPFVQVVACAGVMLVTRDSNAHLVALYHAAALLGVLSALNFFPLVRSDGYYLLTELAGIPNLRTQAWKWLASSTVRARMRVRLPPVRRMAIAAYAVASVGFVALVLGRALTLIGQVFVGAGSVSISTVVAALSVIVILSTVFRGRSFTP